MSAVFLAQTGDGKKVERECYFPKGGLAVARPAGDDKHWMIGHEPTGMALGPLRWRSKVAAKKALLAVLDMTDWNDPRFNKGNAFFLGKTFYARMRDVFVEHGGDYLS